MNDSVSFPASAGFSSRPLAGAAIDAAYSLISSVSDTLSIEDWRRVARQFVPAAGSAPAALPPAGLMAIEDGQRYLRGLFAYCALPALEGGGVLALGCVAVPDSVYRWPAARALLAAADRCALALDCMSILARLETANRWLAEPLRENGYHADGASFRRVLLDLPGGLGIGGHG